MAMRAKHAFGNLSEVQNALDSGKINSYDILFMDGDTDPKVGWIDKDGIFRLVKNEADLSGVEAELATKANVEEVAELENQIATKVGVEEVDEKINTAVTDSVASAKAYTDGKVEAAISEHMVKKYEITSVPEGTLVRMNESEIRIMCPTDTVWTKQTVGAGGDVNCYYATFKTYVYDDNVVGYIEHLGSQVDKEILNTFSTDEYGRRFQQTWLALAKYDEATDEWAYYGANSDVSHYIGWDYQIDWYDANGKMVASDGIRINLSNEQCHSSIEPYYVGNMMKEVETKINTQIEEKLSEVESSYEIIEF